MTLINKLKKAEEARQGALARREFLKLAGKGAVIVSGASCFSLANPLINYSQQTSAQQEKPIRHLEKARYFPLYYMPGDLGYAEREFDIPMDWVISKTIKEGDTLEKWWGMEEQDLSQKRLYQLVFLTINNPRHYPKGFTIGYNLKEEDIMLPKGKKANFIDLNKDGMVLGEPGEYMPWEDALKITDLKNNYGELLDGTNRR